MNKKLVISSSILAGVSLFTYIWVLGSENALVERFPTIDPKIVYKVHRQMIWDGLRGRITADTDEELDKIFLARVQQLTQP